MFANKVKSQDVGVITLTEEYNLVITKKMPKNLKDPGKFNLPIQIGNNEVVQALSD